MFYHVSKNQSANLFSYADYIPNNYTQKKFCQLFPDFFSKPNYYISIVKAFYDVILLFDFIRIRC